jgi:serpin B
MQILLPKISMEEFENDYLNTENYYSWILSTVKFNKILIPKFKLEQETDVVSVLKKFGITKPFIYGEADFSGITRQDNLSISGIFHKAFVDVNEEGTEAAAATAVVAGSRSASVKPRNFIADHAFIFLIRDQKSKSILFIGKLVKP